MLSNLKTFVDKMNKFHGKKQNYVWYKPRIYVFIHLCQLFAVPSFSNGICKCPSNFTGCATSYMKCTKLIALNFTQNGNAKFEKRGKLCKFREKIALILGNLLQKGRRRYEDMRKKEKNAVKIRGTLLLAVVSAVHRTPGDPGLSCCCGSLSH